MKLICIFLLIYSFLKSYYYSMYEIKEKRNKPGGIVILIMAILGLVFPISLLIFLY